MKIQLKRSNVLENSAAKAPTASQMEYGELAVNYNSKDPVLFIKDSTNQIVRLTNIQEINDGQIRVNAGEGLTASGDNATANQKANTTRVLGIDTTWLTNFISNWTSGNIVSANDGAIIIDPGIGLVASGSNATANQSKDTIRMLSVNTTWLDNYLDGWGTVNLPAPAKDGQINVEAGDGLTASGDNATANQAANTTRTLAAVADAGYAIDVTATGIRFGDNWSNIPALP